MTRIAEPTSEDNEFPDLHAFMEIKITLRILFLCETWPADLRRLSTAVRSHLMLHGEYAVANIPMLEEHVFLGLCSLIDCRYLTIRTRTDGSFVIRARKPKR